MQKIMQKTIELIIFPCTDSVRQAGPVCIEECSLEHLDFIARYVSYKIICLVETTTIQGLLSTFVLSMAAATATVSAWIRSKGTLLCLLKLF